MIVKNENGPHLLRCLRSVRPFISSWVVVDTGSTDGTQEAIRSYMSDIPGQLVEREWVDDFAHSRNQALELACDTQADFAMVLDADDYVVSVSTQEVPLHQFTTDVVSLAGMDEGEGMVLLLATFIRLGSSGLRFHGRVHEVVVLPDGSMPFGVCDPSYETRRTRDGAASVDNAAKQAYYRKLLLRSVADDGSDYHSLEALARDALASQDGETARKYLEAALRFVPGKDVHRRYTLRLSRISTFQPFMQHVREVIEEVQALMWLCPGRAEAPRWAAHILRTIGRVEQADRLDIIADEKTMLAGAYGIDYRCYKAFCAPGQARSSSVKYIVLPGPITINTFVWTFSDCVSYVVDNAEVFEKPASMIRAGQRILTAVDKAVEEKKLFVELREEDYVNLKQVFENPTRGYGSFAIGVEDPTTKAVIGQEAIRVPPKKFLPFIDAVENATDSPPVAEQ